MAVYQTPGVYIEEVSSTPQPVKPSGTTETAIVGLVELPATFRASLDNQANSSESEDGDEPVRKEFPVDITKVQGFLSGEAQAVSSTQTFHEWRLHFGCTLYKAVCQSTTPSLSPDADEAQRRWDHQSDAVKDAWHSWLRATTGMQRLELSLTGFFANGGTKAYLGVTVFGEETSVSPTQHCEQSFGLIQDLALICAPGLNLEWQQAILSYASPQGRDDLFAIMDTPRYLLTDYGANASTELNEGRWRAKGPYTSTPFEGPTLEYLASNTPQPASHTPTDAELEQAIPRDFEGYGAAYAPWVVMENPLRTREQDAYVVAPPSGHIAGAFVSNDNKHGVQKVPANQILSGISELAVSLSSQEQGPINTKNINMIRHQPGGVTIWGGRTCSNDPLWRYINTRRVMSFLHSSIQSTVKSATFFPNNEETRSNVVAHISHFLYSQWQKGVLDGATQGEAYSVQCDENNNPDALVKEGIFQVDVGLQPPYPSEFVVLRFRETS